MSAHQTQIKTAQQLLSDKVMAKLRENPKAYGKVSIEVTIQAGQIQNIQAIDSTSVKPE
jgi:uncharacterized protein with FMN-binding domain